MLHLFKEFGKNESGAVTVDWVVLTAAIIGLGAATMASVGSGTTELASLTSDTVSSSSVGQRFFSSSMTAGSYFERAVADNGGVKAISAFKIAKGWIEEDAPEGFYSVIEPNEDLPLGRYGLIDEATGKPIYYSADGQTYSIGGNTISEDDYWAEGHNKKGMLSGWIQHQV